MPHLRCSGMEFDASKPLWARLTCDAPTALTRRKNHVGGKLGEAERRALVLYPSAASKHLRDGSSG